MPSRRADARSQEIVAGILTDSRHAPELQTAALAIRVWKLLLKVSGHRITRAVFDSDLGACGTML